MNEMPSEDSISLSIFVFLSFSYAKFFKPFLDSIQLLATLSSFFDDINFRLFRRLSALRFKYCQGRNLNNLNHKIVFI